MAIVLLHSERFVEHETPPGHPERPARAEVFDVITTKWKGQGIAVVAPREATDEQLARVHDADYLATIRATRGRAVQLDADTYTSPVSQEIAALAAGATVDAVERVLRGDYQSAVALVRPPGHHAERDRAMGFCLYNNVAVGAAHARALGASKVAIVDYDVHHGNGTQHIFENNPHVLYVSTHQSPYYPGTGDAQEIGTGEGRGFTVNLPMTAGAVAEDFRRAFDDVVLPVLRQFAPDLVMISAGFDAHEDDPLGGMRLTAPAFGAMTLALRHVAEDCCGGRVVAVTEGGYDLHALASSLDATIAALHGPLTEPSWPASGVQSRRGERAVEAASRALRSQWELSAR